MPEWMRSDIAEIFATAEVLLAAVGFPVFEPPAGARPAAEQDVFLCRRGGARRAAFTTKTASLCWPALLRGPA